MLENLAILILIGLTSLHVNQEALWGLISMKIHKSVFLLCLSFLVLFRQPWPCHWALTGRLADRRPRSLCNLTQPPERISHIKVTVQGSLRLNLDCLICLFSLFFLIYLHALKEYFTNTINNMFSVILEIDSYSHFEKNNQ